MTALSTKTFNAIWYIAAAAGLSSAPLYSHPVSGFRLLSPILLFSAISLAVFLSLFAKRETLQIGVHNPVAAPALQESVKLRSEEQDAPAKVSEQVVPSHAQMLYIGKAALQRYSVNLTVKTAATKRLYPQMVFRNFDHLLVYAQSSTRMQERRLNLLEDAVHVARQLQGTGLAVEIKEDCILVRDPVGSSLEEPAPLSKGGSKDQEWVN